MSSSPTVFRLFNKLPPEIRSQIWRASVPDHRIVPIKYQRNTCSYVPRIGPPAILQVNQESHQEGLAIYHDLRLEPVPVKDCYVDLTRDIVYLKTSVREDDIALLPVSNIGRRGRFASPPGRQIHASLPPMVEEPEEDEALPLLHSKIILYDLLNSVDGEAMLPNLHVNSGTWSAIWRYYRYRRHRLSVKVRHVVLVYERGSGPLCESLQLKPILGHDEVPAEERPPYYPYYGEDRIANKMSRSFRSNCMAINRKDQCNGLPLVLNITFEAKSLNRDERVD
ncbi:hypothetical protein NA56DRAFT_402696 [Hyaloscypha hepaticicola]|uniref:2EXR domain-containing protein n=1 Tax=Hyaloscypha hepaticicola TaxID=2082293 RepID=A0A2J6PIZ0_9HELO|nr:hypothetical protein NA56DRAFT_402696 [Hyaloscypha hepaticicola]